ncbi:unnamed protein product [Penicillium salamii]|uniref:Glucose-methanol-choline oxidoreductase N-terminal domain-containing protein n=1 Tax=Penicillium salamii TaxID=1612424 RepID=A0A9W4JRI4_9EURO|nr:unnamed protein product [Penicillium salamii]CAG8025544.1 unnamed protein product [Penicillium salamii]CAG8060634.1 unnamed protein product [Penicillium salamii]CAG8082473.1 unnamed protein product [Penicillium salamii]CAG8185031.1 unnamed protein product [Penicillium salamii]
MADNLEIPTCSIEEFLNTSFDYIICGGGTAGCTIAARLSEIPNVTVGLIEAGKSRLGDPVVDIPGMFPGQFANPDYDWCIYSEPQAGNRGRVHQVPRGKYLGGSSGMNVMVYVRGSMEDYDNWASFVGDEGWSAASMQGYMRKHQTLEPAEADLGRSIKFQNKFHGTNGPIHTSFNEAALPVECDFLKACEDTTGISEKAEDPWSGHHLGIHHVLATITRKGPNKGKRSYSAGEYYAPNHTRPNLKVLCEARVNKVLLDDRNRATGVSITRRGEEFEIKVAREVILSAGAVFSPHILELSGIGDPAFLKSAGVSCKVKNAAIGANLQDHAISFVNWEVNPHVATGDVLRQAPEAMQAAIKQYAETKDGPLAAVPNIMGFYSAKSILSEGELQKVMQSIRKIKPDTAFHAKQIEQVIANLNDEKSSNIQIVLVAAMMNPEGDPKNHSNLFTDITDPEKIGITAVVGIQNPVSRGYIHIKSADPAQQPTIQPNWLTEEADAIILGAALRMADRVGRSKHIRDSISSRLFPRPNVDLQNLDQAKEAAHDIVSTMYHLCGTVALGEATDSHLRVKGVQGLRVADASIFPNNLSGNIQASVYAVAEKAADLIKDDLAAEVRNPKAKL